MKKLAMIAVIAAISLTVCGNKNEKSDDIEVMDGIKESTTDNNGENKHLRGNNVPDNIMSRQL